MYLAVKKFLGFCCRGFYFLFIWKKSGYFGNVIDGSDVPSKALKESGKLLYEVGSQFTNYGAQNDIKEK